MILFKNDWLKYPNAIVHLATKNKSAVVLAQKLKMMGIKNHLFFLALFDPDLEHIDPFSEDLDDLTKKKIAIEIKLNPWYYFREIACVPSIAGNQSERKLVDFNRGNLALWWSFFNHIVFILIQCRQTGKSFCTDHLNQLLMNFVCTNTQINLLTKDEKLRKENIARLKNIYEELPPYLKLKTKDDANNTEEITVNALSNKYLTHVPSPSPKMAGNKGRGLTSPIAHIDEGPFQPNIDIAYPAMAAAMGAAIEEAKRNDAPYGVIWTTTAGKKDEREGKFVFDLCENSAQWSETFYDAEDAADLERMVRANSRKGEYRIYAVFSHIALGKTDEWLKEQLERSQVTGEAADRDFFNIWTSGTQSNPLPISVLDRMTRSIVEPVSELQKIGGFMLRWYLPEEHIESYMASHTAIAGIDTSDGIGNDDITLVLTDTQSGAVVGTGTYNLTNLITLAEFFCALLIRFDNLTMIIERRSSAVTMMDYMFKILLNQGIDPFKRIFNWIINDPHEYKNFYEEYTQPAHRRSDNLYDLCKKYFGYATSGGGRSSRSELYSDNLKNAAGRYAEFVHDRTLVDQIKGLITKNGRIDHEIGKHDDMVIAWLLTHWFLTRAKNLKEYGINPNLVLVRNDTPVSQTEDEYLDSQIQRSIRDRIETLYGVMLKEDNEVLLERYQNELKRLSNQLVLKQEEYFSVSAFMEKLKSEKRKRSSQYSTSQIPVRSLAERMGYNRVDFSAANDHAITVRA